MGTDKKIADTVLDLVGGTPMVRLNRVVPAGSAQIVAKIESMNPAGSVKDRIALNMIETAEREGRLKPGDTIVEPTSGNTGIGLAMVAAVKGYRLIVTMPEDMSLARRDLLARYVRKEGLEVICCASAKDALAILEDVTPVAITLDVIMEDMNGLDALKALKANPSFSAIPVAVITIAEEREQAFALGAEYYLSKPVDPDMFASILAKYAVPAGIPPAVVV